MKEELASLIEAVAKRDRKAFETLYRHTSRKMFAVALRIVREPGMAQDVIQDAYIRLWRYAHTFNAKLSSPETWIHQIVRNRALDHLSSQSHTVNSIPLDHFSDDENMADSLISESGNPASDTDETGRLMQVCVQKLEGKYRQVLTLAYHHGMSHAEISEHLDVPLGTVKTWARRGLIELKEIYEDFVARGPAAAFGARMEVRGADLEAPGYMV